MRYINNGPFLIILSQLKAHKQGLDYCGKHKMLIIIIDSVFYINVFKGACSTFYITLHL